MITIKKALVCIDLSDYSKMTIEYAYQYDPGMTLIGIIFANVNAYVHIHVTCKLFNVEWTMSSRAYSSVG